MRKSLANSSTRVAVAGLALALWLALLLPSLNRNYLQNVDELWHARVAQGAALEGHWWPLMLAQRPFFEKPPLVPWLAAATAKLSGQALASWPYRLWNTLGGALALACLWGLAWTAGSFWGGLFAAALLGLQGDFVFHCRFFSMDTPFLGCSLLAVGLMALALGLSRPSAAWTGAGWALALAFLCKSWFVLALWPALGLALLTAGPPVPWRRMALPLGLAILAWLALYTAWSGPAFLVQEWRENLWARLGGATSSSSLHGHLSFYGQWIWANAPAMVPLLLALPLGLWPAPGGSPVGRFVRVFAWALSLTWILGMVMVQGQTMNYVIPLEAALALCLGLGLTEEASSLTRSCLATLLLLSALATAHKLSPDACFWGGGLIGLLLAWSRAGQVPSTVPGNRGLLLVSALLLLSMQFPDAWSLCAHPGDGLTDLAPLLMSHPPRDAGETLWAVGVPTWGVDFYSRYQVQHVQTLAEAKAGEAVLRVDEQGLHFIPAKGDSRYPKVP